MDNHTSRLVESLSELQDIVDAAFPLLARCSQVMLAGLACSSTIGETCSKNLHFLLLNSKGNIPIHLSKGLLCSARATRELVWEQLHLGYWKDVHQVWRDAYSLVSVVIVLLKVHRLHAAAKAGFAPYGGNQNQNQNRSGSTIYSESCERPQGRRGKFEGLADDEAQIATDGPHPSQEDEEDPRGKGHTGEGERHLRHIPNFSSGGAGVPYSSAPTPLAAVLSALRRCLRQIDLALLMGGARLAPCLHRWAAAFHAHIVSLAKLSCRREFVVDDRSPLKCQSHLCLSVERCSSGAHAEDGGFDETTEDSDAVLCTEEDEDDEDDAYDEDTYDTCDTYDGDDAGRGTVSRVGSRGFNGGSDEDMDEDDDGHLRDGQERAECRRGSNCGLGPRLGSLRPGAERLDGGRTVLALPLGSLFGGVAGERRRPVSLADEGRPGGHSEWEPVLPSGGAPVTLLTEPPALDTFFRDFMLAERPVVIRGAMEHWPALERWGDLRYLEATAGERTVPVEVGSNYLAEGWGQRLMTLKKFLRRYVLRGTAKDAESHAHTRHEGPASPGLRLLPPRHAQGNNRDDPSGLVTRLPIDREEDGGATGRAELAVRGGREREDDAGRRELGSLLPGNFRWRNRRLFSTGEDGGGEGHSSSGDEADAAFEDTSTGRCGTTTAVSTGRAVIPSPSPFASTDPKGVDAGGGGLEVEEPRATPCCPPASSASVFGTATSSTTRITARRLRLPPPSRASHALASASPDGRARETPSSSVAAAAAASSAPSPSPSTSPLPPPSRPDQADLARVSLPLSFSDPSSSSPSRASLPLEPTEGSKPGPDPDELDRDHPEPGEAVGCTARSPGAFGNEGAGGSSSFLPPSAQLPTGRSTRVEGGRRRGGWRPRPIGYLAQHTLFDQILNLRSDVCTPDYCCLSTRSIAAATALEPLSTLSLAGAAPAPASEEGSAGGSARAYPQMSSADRSNTMMPLGSRSELPAPERNTKGDEGCRSKRRRHERKKMRRAEEVERAMVGDGLDGGPSDDSSDDSGDDSGELLYMTPGVSREDAPGHREEEAGGRMESVNAWLGPIGTVTPLHHDPHHNLLAQVVGLKYVRLYPPQCTATLRPFPADTLTHNSSQIDLDDPSTWFTATEETEAGPEPRAGCSSHPPLGSASAPVPASSISEAFLSAPYWDAVLRPGDMLYIPPRWWHYVRATREAEVVAARQAAVQASAGSLRGGVDSAVYVDPDGQIGKGEPAGRPTFDRRRDEGVGPSPNSSLSFSVSFWWS